MIEVERPPNMDYFWSALLVEELIRSGCSQFIIAPGSRSTPLSSSVALNKKAQHLISFDERSAAFVALGYAKATGFPAAIIVTSGTAVANLMPAVVEASLDRIPLIVLSADRPAELRDVQANQTIDQTNFFGLYSRWFFELPCPNERTPVTLILSTASYAVQRSRHPVPGPVQINCTFREPLAPIREEYTYDVSALKTWASATAPSTLYDRPHNICSDAMQDIVSGLMEKAERGLVVVGAVKEAKASLAILDLARTLQWPVIANISSGLRHCRDPLIIYHDHYLWLHKDAQTLDFDVVVQFGGRLLSKSLEAKLQSRRGQTHIFVDDHPERSDPALTVTHRIDADLYHCANGIKSRIKATRPSAILPLMQQMSQQLVKHIEEQLEQGEGASEPWVARYISQMISKDSMLMACTSMPIRDYHMFASYRSDGGPMIVVNRGASGIDGLMSTAIGYAFASKRRCTVLIGDLAFMHDANALALLDQISMPVCIVVINNQGGGIFSFLPISSFPDLFTPFVDAPHQHNLSGLSSAFNLEHYRVKTKSEFETIFTQAHSQGRHVVIEVASERCHNFKIHERIKNEVCALSVDQGKSMK